MARDANAKSSRIVAPLALAAALTACQAAPRPPLLSPLDQTKLYGYSERALAPDRVTVTYTGPSHRVVSYVPNAPDAETQAARAEATDLATWRAAAIAQAQGFKGFRIVSRDIQIDSRPTSLYGAPDTAGWPTWRYPGGFSYGSPGYATTIPTLDIQARASVTAVLRHEIEPGDEDAAAAIARLRAAHPGADGTAPEPNTAPVRP